MVAEKDTAYRANGTTRSQVMSILLKQGPVAAAEIGTELGLSPAGVRRHLDKLVEEGMAETCQPRAVAGDQASRGRPAKHFQLTVKGREEFGTSYDTIALEAVDVIESIGGEEAVREFARRRAERIFADVQTGADSDDPEAAVQAVAAALEAHGYEPTVRRTPAGIQLCQHHCPVSAVAAEHPELCEAEHEAIARIVDTHVQPLALIVDGHGICTTNIPLAPKAGNETKGAADND
ncbi:metalloregulator ArsR/SmtB family transcription factor [uncultured Corynebacterium sp.]|uniref:helix-turn-helix transcriptional regulator n=1 Tax=uncultured Corynebacterium sp. TaxID=159447 RepID=UPI002593EB4A|nr:ArsR family transcriptional regulator [uncultured Corynebacterium sp.]